ncbi:MAG: hypothetical protein GX301_10280 [Gracilibacteraceae bacterium]|nr:hypothetical protein [Gracilibacteraceae bacterium]
MNIMKPLYRVILPILILLSLFSFASCSPQKKPDLQKSQKEAEEKKPPDELDKLKDSIKKVEKSLEAVYEESKKPIFIQQEKIEKQASEGAKKQEEEQGGQSGEQGGGGGKNGGGENSGGQQNQPSQIPKLTPEQLKMKLEQEKY